MRSICLLLLLHCLVARGEIPPAGLEFVQKPGNEVALGVALRDEAGRTVPLRDYFGVLPVVLVLGYFQCPNLCSTVLDGVMESLLQAGLPASAYRLVAVSIDPRENPAAARHKQAAYRNVLAGKAEAHFLTGDGEATGHLSASVGFPYAWDSEHGQYVHPAGFVVATPGGRIARYFLGVRFEPRDVRLALVEASAGRVGSAGDRLLLLCSHYDPESGRYTFAAMTAVRAASLLMAAALAAWVWRRRAGKRA